MDNTFGLSEQLTYDGLGNLTQVKLLSGTTVTSTIDYIVDGKGRRIGKKVNGVLKKQWIYDGQLRIVAELTTSGSTNTMTRFVYGSRTNTPELMLKYTSPGATPTAYRIFSDHLGSPRIVVNASNANDVLLKVHYSAFGIPMLEGGSLDAVTMGFAGGLFDPDTSLVRFGARDYDARFGRWVSKEPLRFNGGGTNFYVYAHNDPINYVDRDGRFPLLVAVGVAAGAAAGVLLAGMYEDYIKASGQGAANKLFPDTRSEGNNFVRHCVAACIAQKQLGDISNSLMNTREDLEQLEGHSPDHCTADGWNNDVGQMSSLNVDDNASGLELISDCTDACMGNISMAAWIYDNG